MGAKPKPDFGGYATKAGIQCADGRTIMPDAFKHQDTLVVPLVWQHGHSDPTNILGHALLENREDGVYTHAFFNDTPKAQHAKMAVAHKDITQLSIYANQLKEQAKHVIHGVIREVSLVIAGANPGALIDPLVIQHGDEQFSPEGEAIITTGLLIHADGEEPEASAAESETQGRTVQDVYDDMSEDEQGVVHTMVVAALKAKADNPDKPEKKESATDAEHSDLTHQEGSHTVTRNLFEGQKGSQKLPEGAHVLTHDAIKGITADFVRTGSFKESLSHYMLQHGIDSIDLLFPDARLVTQTPEWDKRRTEWVSSVINGVKKSPFSRIKSIVANITFEDARAKGYIKGNFKKEEFFSLVTRVTTPATVYKKQKIDRDDIIDITDFDVVTWLWGEMRLMLDEEIARAILIGDGRPVEDPSNPGEPNPDKIADPMGQTIGEGIRSIANEPDLYAATVTVNSAITPTQLVDKIVESMRFYKGSGSPTLYTTLPQTTKMLLAKDTTGRRLYGTRQELASAMGVANIVDVEVMEDEETELFGIVVNLTDYTVGTDKGGEIAKFDQFDIDYNKHTYLLETRLSGALTKIRSAVVLRFGDVGDVVVDPVEPAFNSTTGVITIPTETGLVYKRKDTGATVAAGAMTALAEGASLTIFVVASTGYFLDNNIEDEWTFTRDVA